MLSRYVRPVYPVRSPATGRAHLRAERLEDRATPTTLVGLATPGNALVTFDAATPATVEKSVTVTGLQAGENLVGIAYRPASGQLFGVGDSSRVYVIDPGTGAATQDGNAALTPALSGTAFGVGFDPIADQLRVVSNTGQDLRVNPTTGAVAAADPAVAYDPATFDAVVGGAPPAAQVTAVAYTNDTDPTTKQPVTTEYVIDSNLSLLSTQGSGAQDPVSSNTGTLFPVSGLGFTPARQPGLAIEPATDAAFAASAAGNGTDVYMVNIATGAATKVGTVPGQTLGSLAVVPPAAGAGTIQLSAAAYAFGPDRGPIAVTVTRTGGTATPATVAFATTDGTAVGGVDYVPASGTISFAAGQASQTIFLALPSGPAAPAAAKSFTLTLSGPTGGAALGPTTAAAVTIPAVTAAAPSGRFYAVGGGPGAAPQVKVYDVVGGALAFTLTPFDPTFTGGVTVATGDVTGDGVDDVVVGTGAGGGPRVQIYDGASKQLVADFFAYEPSFSGGVNVAVGDVNGDGFGDVMIGSGVGGGPRVRVFSGDGIGSTSQTLLADFFAYESSFRGGVNVGSRTATGKTYADVVAGAGVGGGPRIEEFDGAAVSAAGASPTPTPTINFFAFDPSFRNGVAVASGDVTGSGVQALIGGAGPGGGPNVRVFDPTTLNQISSFFAFDQTSRGGVTVTARDLTGTGTDEVVVGNGPGGQPQVAVFNTAGTQQNSFLAFDAGFTGGVFVG